MHIVATLKGLDKKIDQIIRVTLSQYANRIFSEAMSNAPASIRSTFRLRSSDDGMTIEIFSDSELAAYIEYGTGKFASLYLMGKPQEMIDNAMEFFINGLGMLAAKPYLWPAYYKYKDDILPEIEQKIQNLFNRLKIR